MRTFEEIRREVAEGKIKQRDIAVNNVPHLTEEQEEEIIKKGNETEFMMNTDGWKNAHKWILDRLNINNILKFKPEELIVYQQYVQAFTDFFNFLTSSVRLRDNILEERRKQDGKG